MLLDFPLYPEARTASCTRVAVDCLAWVRLTGEVDVTGVPALGQALSHSPEELPMLVMVDMREVTSLDATAARVLLDANAAISRDGGRMVFVRGDVRFDWWFALLGLDERLEVVGVWADGTRTTGCGRTMTRRPPSIRPLRRTRARSRFSSSTNGVQLWT